MGHQRLVDPSINWTSPFLILGGLVYFFIFILFWLDIPVSKYWRSKKISNDQELTQSDPTSCPQNQKGKTKYINWRQFTKGTCGKPNEQLFPK